MTTALHGCAAEACDKQIERRLLMCIEHWRMVPKALQREVLRWSHPMGRRDGYFAAVRAAIAAVREKEVKRQQRKDSTGDVLDFG